MRMLLVVALALASMPAMAQQSVDVRLWNLPEPNPDYERLGFPKSKNSDRIVLSTKASEIEKPSPDYIFGVLVLAEGSLESDVYRYLVVVLDGKAVGCVHKYIGSQPVEGESPVPVRRLTYGKCSFLLPF